MAGNQINISQNVFLNYSFNALKVEKEAINKISVFFASFYLSLYFCCSFSLSRGHAHFLFSLCPLWKINIVLPFFPPFLSLSLSPSFSLSPVLLLFSSVPRGGERGEKRPHCWLCTVQMLFHLIHQCQLLPSAERQDAGERGGDESALIDKLNYWQSPIPPGPFFSWILWNL